MKSVLYVLMCACLVTMVQADLVIINGSFTDKEASDTDVVGWYDQDTVPGFDDWWTADWWMNTSYAIAGNPFPDNAVMLGDGGWDAPYGAGGRWLYQAIGTKVDGVDYQFSLDYAQPTDGNENRAVGVQIDIYQGIFSDAANNVDIVDQGLTLITSIQTPFVSDLDIHHFSAALDLSLATTTDELWIRISNLPGAGSDAGSWVIIDNVQIVPEPATMVLLGLGSLAIARKRK